MRNILHWKENREGKYIDGECTSYNELPDTVPGGSVWYVSEIDSFFLRHPNGDRWIDVTAVAHFVIPEKEEI